MTEPLDLAKLRQIVDRYGSTMVELAPGTTWDEAGAIGQVLAVFPAVLAELEAARRTMALLPDELTRLADLLEASRPADATNRAEYFEGWLDAIHAVQDELRSLRSAIDQP